jgi:hypothetical protein
MRLITQVWSTAEGRYLDDELDLCECLGSLVREGLRIRSTPTDAPDEWEVPESA